MAFVHLHSHTHYSLLDGLSKVPDLVEAVNNYNMKAIAITDHGVMYGAIEFFNECNRAGIKPIIGMEAYISPRKMSQKDGKIDANYHHLTLLAKNHQGYLNLIQLTTLAHTEGFYYKPRIDLALLKKHSEGLIALSGCPRGEIPRTLKKSVSEGEAVLRKYLEIFPKEDFYLELQRNAKDGHEEIQPNKLLVALGAKFNVKTVATQDCHYINKDDAEAQDLMVCIGTGRTVDEPNRLDMRDHDLSLRSSEEMETIFSDLPEAIASTIEIADKCKLDITVGQRLFPKVKLPENTTSEQFLEQEVNRLAIDLYGENGIVPTKVQERIDYELDIICQKGFAPYFLMVADIVKGAHQLGVITNTRGSAAGSIVGKILKITNVDPLYYQLPFERFLTKDRPGPPDIDLDIADNRRGEVIDWITTHYGKDKVAQMITFGTMKARAVVRDVGRALAVPYGKCDRIAKMIPLGKQGFKVTLESAMEQNAELKSIYDSDEETRKIIDIGKRLEGCVRHASVHAAGIVITPTKITDNIPLQLESGGEHLITQYDMYALDENMSSNAVGAIKLDLLGIRNLAILERAVKLVKYRHNLEIDLANLPHPDPKTFKMLSNGLTFGVFQLGSSGMTKYLKDLEPDNIFELSAMIALYRPGPLQFIPDYIARKHNPKLISYLDPSLEDILERTYGILVYQDDLLIIAHDLAGYTWSEVDKFRKAVGKKIPAEMAKQKEKFIQGCMKTSGWSESKATQVWTWIEPFAAYGFNKAHSASYAVVSYQTAYMKSNYPVEFMAALMTAESGDEDKIRAAVEECKAMGISVLPPNVAESYGGFTVIDDKTIRFGLDAIKNLGSDVVNKIIECHKSEIKLDSLQDFLLNCHTKNLNKKSWEALAKSGALDNFGHRAQLLASTEIVLDYLRVHFKAEQIGQASLFGKSLQIGSLKLVETPVLPTDQQLKYEKDHLGLFVSGHPLDGYKNVLADFAAIKSIQTLPDNRAVEIAGIIVKQKRTITKKNDPMAFFELEDQTGSIEIIVFPKTMPSVVNLLELDQVIRVAGKVSTRDGAPKIIAETIKTIPNDELYAMALTDLEQQKQLTIHVPSIKNQEVLMKIKEILAIHPGDAPVYLSIGEGPTANTIKTKSTVRISQGLIEKLRNIPEVSMIYDRMQV